ncbi:sigma-70 family RNA polymerase sigma factor [Clostridium botulinum]|uniref:sigma-70 family RNA polymerase sigma factor n=1 Tax=Clostridium botulinum TaxID=1491 RepID=UPI00016BA490|nr:sigma-70 family RNA polymerase sigma factor [Clostridium botulinum]AJD26044.1 RNA polymerase sigma factor, sigma-70 family protein [Clostridium botulinum CDC_297]EDT87292.1 putative bacteriocin [Clostridium botulinum Bf]MBY6876405.1 sigma-70 family RNA polymerase sigma factor [Clostridium botulinum]MBY6880468.1 sigma-70 family RNA polymerase sigma factor [Clostridium botulinum]MBY6890414.1 sigma-70 family RNA polymerase sigma factor [Clostridium botulinum]
MRNNLYTYVKNAKLGDKSGMEYLINKFELLINKYSYRLMEPEDGKSELILKLIRLVKKVPLDKKCFKEDKYIISYIKISLKRQYIYLYEKQKKLALKQSYLDENNEYSFDKSNIIFYDLIKNLNNKEKYIFIKKYIYNFNSSEIARNLKISRQNVYITEKRAIKKIINTFQLNNRTM